ncbi:MAG: FG-GAP repeat protein, partial [Proteobacteria bacterium]|nr:FG-GAP repeat protein [Pseudomonadota bacterium]
NSYTGRSYVVFGGPGVGKEGKLWLSGLNGSNGFKIDGENLDDQSGSSVSRAGDINGDGYADLIIGAYGYPQGNNRGRSYVIFGREFFVDASNEVSGSPSDRRVIGDSADDNWIIGLTVGSVSILGAMLLGLYGFYRRQMKSKTGTFSTISEKKDDIQGGDTVVFHDNKKSLEIKVTPEVELPKQENGSLSLSNNQVILFGGKKFVPNPQRDKILSLEKSKEIIESSFNFSR